MRQKPCGTSRRAPDRDGFHMIPRASHGAGAYISTHGCLIFNTLGGTGKVLFTMPIAMYPGSFDPVTRGHLDIIKRSSRMFDKLIVAVLVNSAKTPLFTVEERVAMLRECCKDMPNVEVDSFNGLTVSFAKQKNATVMVRGLRAVTDFENEIQLAHTNYAMMPEIETVFLATAIKWSYLSSTIVREAAHYGQDVSRFVPPNVEKELLAKRRAGEL